MCVCVRVRTHTHARDLPKLCPGLSLPGRRVQGHVFTCRLLPSDFKPLSEQGRGHAQAY